MANIHRIVEIQGARGSGHPAKNSGCMPCIIFNKRVHGFKQEMCFDPVARQPYTLSMDQAKSDEELMTLYREGDAAAFEFLYSRHKAALYRFILRQCDDQGTTDELFQEVWMKLIQGRHRYEIKAKFTTYLYTIARNRIIDYYRSRGNTGFHDDGVDIDGLEGNEQLQPERLLERQQDNRRLMAGIAVLPILQREALLLREEAGMSLAEIATLTNVNIETVKSRLRYAIRKLHQVMRYDR